MENKSDNPIPQSKNQFREDTFFTLWIKAPIALLSFVSSVFLARILGPEGNGLYSFVMANLLLAVNLLGLNIGQPLIYYVSSKLIDSKAISSIISLLGGIVLAFFVTSTLILYNGNSWVKELLFPVEYQVDSILIFFLVYFIVEIVKSAIEGVFIGLRDYKRYNYSELAFQILRVLVLVYIFITPENGNLNGSYSYIFYLLTLITVFNLVILIITYFTKYKFYFHTKYIRIQEIKKILRYTMEGYISGIANFFTKRLDVWIIEFYSGLKALGFYGLATQITNFTMVFLEPLTKVLFPYMTMLDQQKGQKIFFRTFRLVFYLFIGIVLITWILADFFVPLLFGEDFFAAVRIVKILIVGVMFLMLRNLLNTFNKSYNRLKFNIQAAMMGLMVTVILDFILIPKYGIVGAAYASVIAYFSSMLFVLITAIPVFIYPYITLFKIQKEDLTFIKEIISNRSK